MQKRLLELCLLVMATCNHSAPGIQWCVWNMSFSPVTLMAKPHSQPNQRMTERATEVWSLGFHSAVWARQSWLSFHLLKQEATLNLFTPSVKCWCYLFTSAVKFYFQKAVKIRCVEGKAFRELFSCKSRSGFRWWITYAWMCFQLKTA